MPALPRSVAIFLPTVLLLSAPRADAIGFEQFGPAEEHIGRDPDWPRGVEDLLRHPRVKVLEAKHFPGMSVYKVRILP